MKGEGRSAGRQVDDFEIMPRNATVPAGANRLHAGFLRSEAGGVAFEAVGFAISIRDLTGGKNSFEEAAAIARDGCFDAWDFAEIYAGTEDHCNLG